MSQPYLDENGNLVRRVGPVVEVITPGPARQTEMDTIRAAAAAQAAQVEANRATLDTMARKARRLAKGLDPMPTTVAGRDALLKDMCEMLARMWFNERFADND